MAGLLGLQLAGCPGSGGGTDTKTPPSVADDEAVVAEDGSVTIEVLANDGATRLVSVDGPRHGTAEVQDAAVRYVPAADFAGEDQFTYTAADAAGTTARAVVRVTVNPVNDAPVARHDAIEIGEDGLASLDLLANDVDVDGDALTISALGTPAHGAVVQAGGRVVYRPGPDFAGLDTFDYEISDGHGASASADVTVTIDAVNDAPVANADTLSTDEDAAAEVDVLANDTDVDGDVLVLTEVGAPRHGTAEISDGRIVYTPEADFHGADRFTYRLSDPSGAGASAPVVVSVAPVNDAPVAADDAGELREGGTTLVSVLANDTDVDGDVLSILSFTQGTGGAVTQEGDALRYRARGDFAGADTFTYLAGDGEGGTATATVRITVDNVNDAPVANPDVLSVDEDASALVDVVANDVDVDGDALTVTGFGQGAHGAVTEDAGQLRYAPAENYFGEDAFTYEIADGNGATATGTVSVTVAPVADALRAVDDALTTREDEAASIAVLDNDVNVDGTGRSIDAFTQGAHGAVTQDGDRLVYAPSPDFHGADAFTYDLADSAGRIATATVAVTVTPVNDPPTAADDLAQLGEDGALLVDVLANDTDVDGDAVTLASFTQGTHGTVTAEPGGLRYVPDADFDGGDVFTYVASDGHGSTDAATVFVTVNAVNDAPVALDDSGATAEDTPVGLAVLANDSDIDGDVLAIASVGTPSHGTAVIDGDRVLYTPEADYAGADGFDYTAEDPSGAVATAHVSLTVSPVNDAPAATDDAIAVEEDGSVLVNVLENDTDVDGDPLELAGVTDPAHGVALIEGAALRYAPDLDFNGEDVFTYEVRDGQGGRATATVTVTVTPANDAPVAAGDTATVDEDGSVVVDVLANDTDVDGDPLSITAYTQPGHGSVSVIAGGVRYTPDADWNGSDTFSYRISDGNGGTATGVVAVEVTPVNDAPVAVDDPASVDEDGSVYVDVLANDGDVDGDLLIVSWSSEGGQGFVQFEGYGLRYIPFPDFNGTDTFTYRVTDGHGGSATGTVTVTVNPVNDAPVAAADTAALDEDGTILVSVLLNDTDVDQDLLALTGFGQGAHGTVAQEGDALRYTPDADWNGTDGFTYQISDGHGGTATGAVTVTVNPLNDAPVAADDPTSLDQDGTVLLDVLANDTDVDGDVLSIGGFGQGAHGTVAQEGNALRYTPDAGFFGADSFTYDVSDGHGGVASATVNVTVNPPPLPSMDLDLTTYASNAIPLVISEPGTYEIATSFYRVAADTVLYLYDASHTRIAFNDDYSSLYATIVIPLEPGTYSIYVEDLDGRPLSTHLEVKKL